MALSPRGKRTFGEISKAFDSSLSGLKFFEEEVTKHLVREDSTQEQLFALAMPNPLVDPYYFHQLRTTIDYQVAHPHSKLGGLSLRGDKARCALWSLPYFSELRSLGGCFDL